MVNNCAFIKSDAAPLLGTGKSVSKVVHKAAARYTCFTNAYCCKVCCSHYVKCMQLSCSVTMMLARQTCDELQKCCAMFYSMCIPVVPAAAVKYIMFVRKLRTYKATAAESRHILIALNFAAAGHTLSRLKLQQLGTFADMSYTPATIFGWLRILPWVA